MLEGIGLIVVGALALVSLVALFLVVRVFFSGMIERCATAVEEFYTRAFWLGFINTLAVAIVIAVFAALAENMAQFFYLPAILLLVFYIPSALFGLIALSDKIGGQLFPESNQLQQQIYGSVVMILASLFPFLGWYVLFPFLLVLGFGAFLLAVFSKQKAEDGEEL